MRAGALSTINLAPQPPTATSMHTSNNNNRRLDRPTFETGNRLALTVILETLVDLTLDKSSASKLREQIVRSRNANVRKTQE
jgi:hypothetical protein